MRSTMNDFSERMIRGELLLLEVDVKPFFLFLDPGIFTGNACHSSLDCQLLLLLLCCFFLFFFLFLLTSLGVPLFCTKCPGNY